MADDDMTASDGAILLVLMAEAREVLNTEMTKLYGLDVRKEQREKLQNQEKVSQMNSLYLVQMGKGSTTEIVVSAFPKFAHGPMTSRAIWRPASAKREGARRAII